MYLHHIACFRRHRQHCPLPRAPPYICAGPLLACRCSHRLSRFCCQRQRRPLTRASSHFCAGSPLACRLYSYRLSCLGCQHQRCPLTWDPSHTCCGNQSLARVEVKSKRFFPREPQNSLRFVVDERLTPLLHYFTDEQQVPRKSWYVRNGNHLHWLGRSTRLVQVHLNYPKLVYRQNGPISVVCLWNFCMSSGLVNKSAS